MSLKKQVTDDGRQVKGSTISGEANKGGFTGGRGVKGGGGVNPPRISL